MHRLLARRPSPAMVVALAALFVSLGGGAYAAFTLPRNSVGTAQLRRGAVTAAKLHNNAVTSIKVKDHTLLARDFKAGQLPAGPPGPKGDKGDQGAPGPPGPTASGFAEETSITTLSGTPPVVVSLGQSRGTQTPTTGVVTIGYPARLLASVAVDVAANPGGDVWCFLEYAPAGGSFAQMSALPAELNGTPASFALPALGSADVAPGSYDVRARCGATGTSAQATDAQLSVSATAR